MDQREPIISTSEQKPWNERPLLWFALSALGFLAAYLNWGDWMPSWWPPTALWIIVGTYSFLSAAVAFSRQRADRLQTARTHKQAAAVQFLYFGSLLVAALLAVVFAFALVILVVWPHAFDTSITVAAVIAAIAVPAGAIYFWLRRGGKESGEAAWLAIQLFVSIALIAWHCFLLAFVSVILLQILLQSQGHQESANWLRSHDWAVILACVAAGELMIPVLYTFGSRSPNPTISATTRLMDAAQSAHSAILPALAVVAVGWLALLLFVFLRFRYNLI